MKKILGILLWLFTLPYRLMWLIFARIFGIRVPGNTTGMLNYLHKPGDKYKKQQEFSKWLEKCYYPLLSTLLEYRVCPICGMRHSGDGESAHDEWGDTVSTYSDKSCPVCGTTLTYNVDSRLFSISGFKLNMDSSLGKNYEDMLACIEHYAPTMYESPDDDDSITIYIK